MKNRCNGCGCLYNGRECYICQSAADEDDAAERGVESRPVPVTVATLPRWFVFVVGLVAGVFLVLASLPKR